MNSEPASPDPNRLPDARPGGSPPATGVACRSARALAAAERERHSTTCPVCRRHAEVSALLGRQIAMRPPLPAELLAVDAVDRVLERVIAHAERTTVAEALRVAMPVASPSSLSAPDLAAAELAAIAAVDPPLPSQAEWQRLEVELRGMLRMRHIVRRTWLASAGLAACAAAAIVCAFFVSDGTGSEVPIVFCDLEVMPSSDFALIRHGLGR
jgi:hypothetical protein